MIFNMVKSRKRGNYAVTVNSEFVMLARRNPKFRRIVNNASLSLPDGWWVAKSKLIFGGKHRERITGVDLVQNLCEKIGKKPISVGFLGGFGNVADEVKKRQIAKNPALVVKIAEPGDPSIGHDLRLKSKISALGGVDILYVAYGMGRQEYWIDRNRKKLNVGVFVGVGGAFDYIAGVKRRAPDFVQRIGLEWFWRLLWDPARIWRMRVLPVFAMMLFAKWFRLKVLS